MRNFALSGVLSVLLVAACTRDDDAAPSAERMNSVDESARSPRPMKYIPAHAVTPRTMLPRSSFFLAAA